MTLYVYPPLGTITVSPAPGADLATETTLLLIETAVDGLETLVGTTNTNTANTKTAVDLTTTAVGLTTTQLSTKLSGSFVNVAFDEVASNYAGATTDVHTYKLAAATVKTVTVTYVDATKAVISGVKAV